MLTFKVTTVGASAGFILTKEAMARLKVQKGDTVYLTEAPEGGYRITPYNPEFERQMTLAEEIMHDDRDILRALAKLGASGEPHSARQLFKRDEAVVRGSRRPISRRMPVEALRRAGPSSSDRPTR